MAVSDATVLLAFSLIDRVDILVKLTGKVAVTFSIKMDVTEALGQLRPDAAFPNEDQVEVAFVDVTSPALRLGETESLELAVQRNAKIILSDDPVVRQAAAQKGLKVLGTPGLVYAATRKGMLDEPEAAIDALEALGYTFSPNVLPELKRRTT